MPHDQPAYCIWSLARSDASQMASMGAELFIDTFGHLYSQRNLELFLNRVHTEQAVLQDMDAGRVFWIAGNQDEWYGYTKFGPMSLPMADHSPSAVELKQLYVRRPYHGKGVSHRLMAKFGEWVREKRASEVYISCWSENYRALAFYGKYGFETVGRYEFEVGDHRDDELILRATSEALHQRIDEHLDKERA
ncbi:MAG: GNAT family N-acetyltransferase [Pirellulales bacterium]